MNRSPNWQQISKMDYLPLVNMLTTPITPPVRTLILKRLIDINGQLMEQFNRQGAEQIYHQGTEQIYPQGTEQIYHQGTEQIYPQGTEQTYHSGTEQIYHQGTEQTYHRGTEQTYHYGTDIIDDIINDLDHNQPESIESELDHKLNRIKQLQRKLIRDKRKRRKNTGETH